MSEASKLRDEIEAIIDGWKDEADEALGRGEPATEDEQLDQADEISSRHSEEARRLIDKIDRVVASDDGDDLSQDEKEDILAEVKQQLYDYL